MNKTNIGHRSTGHCSTGNWSTGHCSTGNWSTGHCSTGNWSTGHYSTGHCSTGDRTTGSRSTGDYSTGDYSTGVWSISDYSTGHFSTVDYSGYGCFDEPCTIEEWNKADKPDWLYFNLTEWVAEYKMTDKEKEENPTYKTTQGYLKVHDYKEAFQAAYNEATREEQLKIKELPNFSRSKFLEISGIDVDVEVEEDTFITVDGVKYKKVEEL